MDPPEPPPFDPTGPPPADGPPRPQWADAGWWEADDRPPPPPYGRGPDLSALLAVIEGVRRLVPAELEEQFTSVLRELLKTLRAMIDWYLERLDRDRRAPEVEDIPIE